MPIDAALVSGSKTYVFSGNRYLRITRGETGPGTVDSGYPKSISLWGWPDGFGANGIDAAFQSGSKAYFFSGPSYIRVSRGDTGPGTVDDGYPKHISTWNWPSRPGTAGFPWDAFGANGIDAAFQSGSKAYFFAGGLYVRVTREEAGAGTVDAGYPKPVSEWNWPPDFCGDRMSAALVSGGKTYSFSGDAYVRVTRGETGPGALDAGYPRTLDAWGWPAPFGVSEGFLPFVHGFKFTNNFQQLPVMPDLPVAIQRVTGIRIDPSYGLCGGMALAARDFFEHNRAIPDEIDPPQSGALFNYLWERQIASFGPDYRYLLKFLQFYNPTTYTREKSVEEFQAVIDELDSGRPTVMGLVYHRAFGGKLWENHQVLALRHSTRGGTTVIDAYDPNYPGCRLEIVGAVETGRPLRPNARWLDAEQRIRRHERKEVIGLIHMDVPSRVPPGGL